MLFPFDDGVNTGHDSYLDRILLLLRSLYRKVCSSCSGYICFDVENHFVASLSITLVIKGNWYHGAGYELAL